LARERRARATLSGSGSGRPAILSKTILALGLCAALLGVRASGVEAGEPKVRQRDPKWKFSVQMFAEWNPAPLPPLDDASDDVERRLAARFIWPAWSSEYVPERARERFREWVLADGNFGVAEIYVIPPGEPGTIEDVLTRAAKKRGVAFHPVLGKPVKTKDGVIGTGWDAALGHHVAGGAWKKDGRQLGIWMATHTDWPASQELEKVVASMTWSDPLTAGPTVDLSLLDKLKLPPERRKAIERSLVRDWRVLLSPSKQYIVLFNARGGKNVRLAETIAQRIEAIRKQQYEVLFPPSAPIEAVSVVRVCGDDEEYRAYGGPDGTGGYWNYRDEELVFFDHDSGTRAVDDDTISVLYHEAFHQYVFYAAGRVSPHSWFNEGHGDYFAGARYKDGKFRIEPFAWRLPVLDRALDVEIPRGAPPVSWIPLDTLVRMSRKEYYRTPALAYAEGWSLVYFLRAIVPTKPDWKAKWGTILDTYFRTLREATLSAKPPVPKAAPDPAPAGPSKPPRAQGDLPPDPTVPPPSTQVEIQDALEAARVAAFKGVDLLELEGAWRSSIIAVLTSPRRRR
jgi:hypothetical protein